MRFCFFNQMPWTDLDTRPETFPFPSTSFRATRAAELYDRFIDQLVFAEACGFDWVGLGEEHMSAYSLTPNPNLVAAIVASRTRRVAIAVMGNPLPLLNPLRVAEEYAMLDCLSQGRLIVGFVRGVPQNYAAYNVDPEQSWERFFEARELILQAWSRAEPFAWKGRHYDFPAVSLWPRPMQTPHPPIVYSVNDLRMAEKAASWKSSIGAIHLPTLSALSHFERAIRIYRESADRAGWDPSPDRFLLGVQACIADSDAEAERRMAPSYEYLVDVISGNYEREKRQIFAETSFGEASQRERPLSIRERIEAGLMLCGSPETVVHQIEGIRRRLGVGVLSLHLQVGNMPAEHVHRSLELFGAGVRPRLAI